MKLYNLKDHNQQVSFIQAVKKGLGNQQGLFFPRELPEFGTTEIDRLLDLDFVSRSSEILSTCIGEEIRTVELQNCIAAAFTFPVPLRAISERISCLELFHGPTLAFKDFGARFMAQILTLGRNKNEKITILTATSGDTGAAVAHAFAAMQNIRVVILYPKDKISALQEQLFCTLGGNIETLAVEGDFDDCQALVKQTFDDDNIREELGLNSANSINISRLLAQVCYYFEAVAQLKQENRNQLVFSVPSGNFGNLTAGLIAKAMGLPIKRFIAATNANDTVPRYLATGQWLPHKTIATLANAMDVSQPNNWPRIEELSRRKSWPLSQLASGSLDDTATKQAMVKLKQQGYLSEPHAAIAWQLLEQQLVAGESGIFLATAHPAKFKADVEAILTTQLDLPPALATRVNLPRLSHTLPADFSALREYLFS